MKNLSVFLIMLFCLGQTAFVSCDKGLQNSADKEIEVNDKDLQFAGEFAPRRVDVPRDGKSSVVFVQSARIFTLSLKLPGGEDYLNVLEKAKNENGVLRIYVFEGTTEIAKVEKATPEVEARYKESIQIEPGITTKEDLPIIPSEALLNSLFASLANANIAFSYATDGCFARAHLMREIIVQAGYDCAKQFLFGNLAANTLAGCCAGWGFHVAPLVRYVSSSGAIELAVLDPSLFTGPVSQSTWINKCTDTFCFSGTYATSAPLHYGYVYNLTASGQPILDNNYVKSNCFNNYFLNYSGCSNAGYPSCP